MQLATSFKSAGVIILAACFGCQKNQSAQNSFQQEQTSIQQEVGTPRPAIERSTSEITAEPEPVPVKRVDQRESVSSAAQVPLVEESMVEKIPSQETDFTLTYDEWIAIAKDSKNRDENSKKYDGKWIAIDAYCVGAETYALQSGRAIYDPGFKVHTAIKRPWLILPIFSEIKLIAQAEFRQNAHARLINATWIVEKARDAPVSLNVAEFLALLQAQPEKLGGDVLFGTRRTIVSVTGQFVKAHRFRRGYGEVIMSDSSGEHRLSINIFGDRIAEVMRLVPGENCRFNVKCTLHSSGNEFDAFVMYPVRDLPLPTDDRLLAREVRDDRTYAKEETTGTHLSDDGSRLLILRSNFNGSERNVEVWNTRDNTMLHEISFEGRKLTLGKFTQKNNIILLEDSAADEVLKLNIESQEIIDSWEGVLPFGCGGISPDRSLALMIHNNEIVARDIETAEEKSRIADHGLKTIRAVVTSPDNQLLAASGYDDTVVKIWNCDNGLLVKEIDLKGEFGANVHIAFSPDGSKFAAAWRDSLIVFDSSDFEVLFEHQEEYANSILGVGFSADSNMVTTGFDNSKIYCWNIENPAESIFYFGRSFSIDSENTTIVIDDDDGVFRFSPITSWSPTISQ